MAHIRHINLREIVIFHYEYRVQNEQISMILADINYSIQSIVLWNWWPSNEKIMCGTSECGALLHNRGKTKISIWKNNPVVPETTNKWLDVCI